MNKDRLRVLLPPEVHPDLDRLVAEYAATGLPEDPTEFISWLHVSGKITAVGLRDALSSVDVSVTLSEPGPDDRQIAPLSSTTAPRHRYLGLLGKGAMGEVHIARDETLHGNVAIKKMISRYARHKIGNARFQTEVQITAQLDHPSIVPVYSFEQSEDGLPAYSMKLVRGRTLTEFLTESRLFYDRQQRPDAEHALPARLDVFLQICNAMHYAHSRGVIHRDLKPDNVMIGPFHEVIVMDWGIAKLVGGGELPVDESSIPPAEAPEPARASLTTIGAAVGTPSYMSPEQAQGRNEDLTASSDQFALGLLLFEMVSLRRAYVGPTGPAVLVKAAHGKMEMLSHLSPTERIPRELAGIIKKATAYEPSARYKDVESLADDVRRFLRDDAVVAAPDRGLQLLTRWVSHHREVVLSIGFGLVLVMVVGVFVGLAAVQQVAEAQRVAAEEHEQALQAYIQAVGRHAHRIDTEFTRYETLLEGLAQGSQATLSQPHPPAPYWLPADIEAGRGPSDLAPAKYYKSDRVAFSTPDVMVSPGLDPASIPDRMGQLIALRPVLWQTIKRSLPDFDNLSDGAAQNIIRSEGAPALWTYVATEDGVIVSLPAVWRYPAGYDPVKTEWYLEGMQHDGPYWFSAGLDESGMGLLVTCTRRIYAPDGHPVGLAALDVGIAHILSTLIDPPDMRAPVESFLVDQQGQIVASSHLKVYQEDPKPFPYTDLIERARTGEPVGRIEHYKPAGGKLVAWSTLDAMGFTYLVMGDGKALLGEK